jgi:hypothetical protein
MLMFAAQDSDGSSRIKPEKIGVIPPNPRSINQSTGRETAQSD